MPCNSYTLLTLVDDGNESNGSITVFQAEKLKTRDVNGLY